VPGTFKGEWITGGPDWLSAAPAVTPPMSGLCRFFNSPDIWRIEAIGDSHLSGRHSLNMSSKHLAKNTYQKFLDDIAGIYDRGGSDDVQLK